MFKGTYTAIITPFTLENEVDFEKLRELVDIQIEGGVDGIVPCGTTGESPTLSFEEHEAVIQTVIDQAGGRVQVIAGTGSNNTVESVHLTKKAAEFGADGALVIMPYYNKPMPEGQYAHFRTVAEEGGLPVVVYNVPGRTGKSIMPETLARMFDEIDNIRALKDAAGDIDFTCSVLNLCDITVLSGDDSLTYPMMAVGGSGVISVASNVVPADMSALVSLAAAGKMKEARSAHFRLWNLFKALFIETNPIPVKEALSMTGRINGALRLPLSRMEKPARSVLADALKELGLIN
jgi:4-hydroxy-tetrahydrodipicolinate synthase